MLCCGVAAALTACNRQASTNAPAAEQKTAEAPADIPALPDLVAKLKAEIA